MIDFEVIRSKFTADTPHISYYTAVLTLLGNLDSKRTKGEDQNRPAYEVVNVCRAEKAPQRFNMLQ